MNAIASDARFWDRIARKYARGKIPDMDGYERTLVRAAEYLEPDQTVLELGCGTGTTALRLAGGVSRYEATDLSGEMIAIAREKLAAAACPKLVLDVATAEEMAGRGKQYDAVLGFNYLHLVGDVAGTLRAIRSLVRPGGLLILKTPCLKDMNWLIRAIVPALRLIGKAPSVQFFSAEELNTMISRAGFTMDVREYHGSRGKAVRPFMVARRNADN